MPTRWSGSGKGSGFSSTPLMTENSAVFAPMPSASVMIAIAVNPGLFRSTRKPKRRSCSRVSIDSLVAQRHHGIYLGGAPRGDVAGQQGHSSQKHRDSGEDRRICRMHIKQQEPTRLERQARKKAG